VTLILGFWPPFVQDFTPKNRGVGGSDDPLEVFYKGKIEGSGSWRGQEAGLRWGRIFF
jgi:hypothetical protein